MLPFSPETGLGELKASQLACPRVHRTCVIPRAGRKRIWDGWFVKNGTMVPIRCLGLDPAASPREIKKTWLLFQAAWPDSTPSILGITCLYFGDTFLLPPKPDQSFWLCFHYKIAHPSLSAAPHLRSSSDEPILVVHWAPFFRGLIWSIQTMHVLP